MRRAHALQWAAIVFTTGFLTAAAAAAELEVRVRDKSGAPVSGLTAKNFELKDGGKQQQLTSVDYVGADAPAGQPRLRIYIAVDVPPTYYPRVRQAIDAFLDSGLEPGVQVSLGGLPFTDNVGQLKAAMSEGGVPDPAAIPASGPPLPKIWTVGSMSQLDGRAVIQQYSTLTASLARYPGKKAVVLYRPTFRIDRDGLSSGGLVSAERARGRSAIGGLNAGPDANPTQNNALMDVLGGQAHYARVGYYPVNPSDASLGGDDQHGLNLLAIRTGGRPILTPGDLGLVFRFVLEDARDYYVLSWNAEPLKKEGFRRLSLKADSKDLKLEAADRFYENPAGGAPPPQPQSLLAEKALADGAASEFELQVTHAVFPGPNGKAVVVVGSSAHPKDLKFKKGPNGQQTEFSTWLKLSGPGGSFATQPRKEGRAMSEDALKTAAADPIGFVNTSAQISGVEPGEYELAVGWGDEIDGKSASARAKVVVPDFSQPASVSTMLVTRMVGAADQGTQTSFGTLLDAGDARFVPDATTKFHVGDTVFVLYTLSNVPAAMLAQPPPVQFGLLKDGQPFQDLAAGGEGVAVEAAKELRYRIMIQTTDVPAGPYKIVVGAPSASGGAPQVVEADFELVGP